MAANEKKNAFSTIIFWILPNIYEGAFYKNSFSCPGTLFSPSLKNNKENLKKYIKHLL